MNKFKNFIKNRIKNRCLWVAVIALITNMGLAGYFELPENFENTATSILNILMLLGIINNPSTESQNVFIDVDGDGIPDHLEDEETMG